MTVETHRKLEVVVHYIAAPESFKTDAAPDETVGQIKKRALTAFGLTEGQTPDGNTVTYTLYHGKTPLENPDETLGQVAGHEHVLQLKLVQQLIQGQTA